ncbi:MAG: metallophosphoesterase [Clostridiales bacterium]|nr:metallophosphoesterase [Clostridiales bacterium]
MTQKEKLDARRKYLAQPVETVTGSPENPETCIQRFTDSGLYFRRFVCDSGRGGEPAEIVQITDVHLNGFDEIDARNGELMLTKQFRMWNRDEQSVKSLKKAMEFASLFDQTVITGDTLDFLSHRAAVLMHRHIWDVDPTALIALGGHEAVRQMQTGVRDATSLESRYAQLEKWWNHDIYYVSRLVRDKALCIVLDNGQGCYWERQIEPLKSDLALARREGYAVLIFQHEPVSTGREEDAVLRTFCRYDPETIDCYNCVGRTSRRKENTAATAEVYNLIISNADIVKGIFVGHQHSAFYTEAEGYFTAPDGTRIPRRIPQPVLEGNPYNGHAGHVMRITVK